MSETAKSTEPPVTGAMLAEEVARAHYHAPAIGHDLHEPCANCGTVRVGEYCHACGQSGHLHDGVGALVHDLAHGVFHFEGKIWRTLPLLAWRPGELTRRYVAGERAKFVSPMALFLFSVFLMFAVVSNLASYGVALPGTITNPEKLVAAQQGRLADLQRQRAAATDSAARERLDQQIAGQKMAIDALVHFKERGAIQLGDGQTLGGEIQKQVHETFGIHWLDEAVAHAVANPALLFYKMKSYGYKYSWALIPLSLPFIALLFAFRRDVGFYTHAIFSIYSLAFMSIGVVVLTLLGRIGFPGGLIALAVMLIPPLHMYRQLKGAYGLTRFGAVWRTAALLGITFVTLFFFVVILFYLGTE